MSPIPVKPVVSLETGGSQGKDLAFFAFDLPPGDHAELRACLLHLTSISGAICPIRLSNALGLGAVSVPQRHGPAPCVGTETLP